MKLGRALLSSLVALLVVATPAATQDYQAGPLSNQSGRLGSTAGLTVVSGKAVKGDPLTIRSRSGNGMVTRYSYQWRDCNASGVRCALIPGATSRSYTVQAGDVGYAIEAKVTVCNLSCSSSISAPTAVVTTSSGIKNPSGAPVPPARVKDSFGTVWKREGYDNFTKNAPRGSWGTTCMCKIVYKGDGGLKWYDLADGKSCRLPAGYYAHCYEPRKVLSVHNGELDFYLHDGRYADGSYGAMGADPGPLMPSTRTRYQTYGRYSVRIKLVYDDARRLDQYHAAWMLWPKNGAAQPCAESDYPELDLNSRVVKAFAHWGCHGSFDRYAVTTNLTHWHTLTQEWGPGFRRYYFDRKLIGQTRHKVYSGLEHWMLHTAPHNRAGDTTRGHILVDWVWVGVRR